MDGLKVIMLLLFPLLISCHSDSQLGQRTEVSAVIPELEPKSDMIVNAPKAHEALNADLFGEFHNRRVSFYTKEDPNLKIERASVKKAVLYYIDDELFQTKYQLDTDITPDLIKKNGKFKIRGLNSRNTYYIKRLKSRILYGNEIVSLINYYQLRWEKGEDEILYQVRRDTVETFYTYTERVKGYKRILKKIEATSD